MQPPHTEPSSTRRFFWTAMSVVTVGAIGVACSPADITRFDDWLSIEFGARTAQVMVDHEVDLQAKVRDADGVEHSLAEAAASSRRPPVIMTSSDARIASVSRNPTTALVRGVSPGLATVVAKLGTDSAVAQVTVLSSEAGGGYPHEPSGMTVIYSNPGTSADQRGEGWQVDTGSNTGGDPDYQANHRTVPDASNPTGTGQSIDITIPANVGGAGKAVIGRWQDLSGVDTGPVAELYISMWLWYPPDMPNSGQKLYYIGVTPRDGAPNQLYTTWERNGGSKVTLQGVSGCSWSNWINPEPYTGRFGRWTRHELWARAESAPGAGDAAYRVWVDGDLVASADGLCLPLLDGFTWYHNWTPAVSEPYNWRIGELYISGRERN